MKKTFLFACPIVVLLALTGVAYPQQPSPGTLIGKASSYFQSVKDRDFGKAAALFHFPRHYSPKERQDDLETVARTLRFLVDKFGAVRAARLYQSPGRFYHVVTGGGDLPYWAKHPSYSQLIYEVDFEKEGKGYVTLAFSNIDGKWEIRHVAYGLSVDRPDAQSRIMAIGTEMSRLIADAPGGK